MDTLLAYSEVDDAFRTLRRGTGKVTKWPSDVRRVVLSGLVARLRPRRWRWVRPGDPVPSRASLLAQAARLQGTAHVPPWSGRRPRWRCTNGSPPARGWCSPRWRTPSGSCVAARAKWST